MISATVRSFGRDVTSPIHQNVPPSWDPLAQHRYPCASNKQIRKTSRYAAASGCRPEHDDGPPCASGAFILCRKRTDATAAAASETSAVCRGRFWAGRVS